MPIIKRLHVLRVPCTAALIATLCNGVAAAASLLSLGPRGVQTLVAEQLFSRAGRWYLLDDGGVCYTYLESPRTHLELDRLVLNAHLTSRLGQRLGNSCAGADLASNITLSGKLRGTDHNLVLDDIRIDRVDDEATRNALSLALQLAPETIPRSATIDVLELVRKQVAPNGAASLRLDQFHIVNITTRPTAVSIAFDVGLSMPCVDVSNFRPILHIADKRCKFSECV